MRYPASIRLYADIPEEGRVNALWLAQCAVRRGIVDVAAFASQYLQDFPGQCEAACYKSNWGKQHRCSGTAIDGGLCSLHVKVRDKAAYRREEVPEVLPQVELTGLDLRGCDVVIVRADVSEAGYQYIHDRAKAVFPDKRIIVLGMSARIEALNAFEMQAKGWIRA